MDARYTNANGVVVNPRVGIITNIYKNAAKAEAAAVIEREAWASDGDETTTPTKAAAAAAVATNDAFVPEGWEEMPHKWAEQVNGGTDDVPVGLQEKYGGKPKPLMLNALKDDKAWLAENLMVTPEDVMKSLV